MHVQTKSLRYIAHAMVVALVVTAGGVSAAVDKTELAPGFAASTHQVLVRQRGDGEKTVELRTRYIVGLKQAPLAMADDLAGVTIPRLDNSRIDVNSPEARSYVDAVSLRQDQFLSQVSSQLGRSLQPISPTYRFQHAFNGMVVDLTEEEARILAAHPEVALVEAETFYDLDTDAGPTVIGAPGIWDGSSVFGNLPTRGEGVVIGVIDSGANIGSPSFAAIGPDGYVHQNPLGSGTFLGWCNPTHPNHNPARDLCNNKMIGGWDFTDAAVVGNTNVVEAPGFEDENGHGTHTASTAGGNARPGALFNGIARNISGVAPHANLVIYDVCFTNFPAGNGSCANTSTLAAINQVLADGVVDVVNYSISGGALPWNEANSQAFLALHNAGVVVSASAGNSGPGASTVAHLEPWVMTVAASTHTRVFGFNFSLTAPGVPPANTQNITVRPGAAPIAGATLSAPIIVSPNFGNGSSDGCNAFTTYPPDFFRRPAAPGGVSGIAVVRLDANTSLCGSVGRRAAAVAAGAAGVLFVDVTPLGLGASGTSYSMLLADWNNVAAHIATSPLTADATIAVPLGAGPGTPDLMANFSSRGPNPFSMLKPDVTAPGLEIMAAFSRWAPGAPRPFTGSANPALNDVNNVISGTSMSAPHNAGAAALLRALNRSWTPTQVKTALMTTAKSPVLKQDGVTPSDPFDRGAGRIDLSRAAKAGLIMDETGANFTAANPATGGNPATLNLPSFQNLTCTGTCSFTRTMRSARVSPVTWTLSVTGFPVGAATTTPTSFAVANSGTANFTLNVDSLQLPAGQTTFGELVLTPSNPSVPVARMPIVIRPAIADIDVVPSSVTASVASGASTTRNVDVFNRGNPTLNWSVDSVGLGTVQQLSQVGDGIRGNSTNFYSSQAPTPGGIYVSEDHTPPDSGLLRRIRVEGFLLGAPATNLNALATQFTFKVYSDAAGFPAGNPEAGAAGEIYSCTRTPLGPNSAGLSFLTLDGATYQLDAALAAAAGCPAPPTLAAGTRYWFTAFPTIPGNTASRRWLWLRGATQNGLGAVFISPLNISTVPTSWTTVGPVAGPPPSLGDFALTVSLDVQCGAPWFSLAPSSGSLGVAGVTNSILTLNATALPEGNQKGFLCLDTNGTDLDEPKVVVPIALTVLPTPTNPSGTGLASPANSFVGGTTLLTVDVTAGTNPASTGLGVAVNLSSIGGSATQTFFDNGSNGDFAASDGRYSFLATIGVGTTAGGKTLTATISDAQARSGTTDIALTIDAPTSPSGTGAAAPSTVARGGNTLLTVNVTPGTSPPSSGIAVVADLSSIGSGSATALFDDGAHNDGAAGDNVFGLVVNVAPDTVAGAKSLAVTITDAQARNGATSIGLTVSASTAPSGSGAASPASVAVTQPTLLTVTTTPGTSPASTGLGVVVNLSSIGGSATQQFSDDGVSNGDLIAGNGVFSFATAATVGTSAGAKTLTATISDAQLRSSTTDIALLVTAPDALSGTGAASPSTVARGGNTLLTVTVTPGANPASTGIAVVVNLSSIGSGSAVAFFDDATNGDQTLGDNIWSRNGTVSADTVAGVKSLAVTITDAQARSATTNIGLTVSASTAPSGIGAASPASLQVGATTLLTVTVTTGTSPGSTGIGVVANLSSIGGNVAQTFYDNGTNGDLVIGDNVFSFSSTIAVGTSLGAKSLPVSIADAQLRTASSNIGLIVVGPSIFGSGFE